jgi:hypothetical protein
LEQQVCISGSTRTRSVGAILFARPDCVMVNGNACSGEEMLLLAEPQQGCLLRRRGGIVVLNNPVPQGQTVVWTGIPRQGAKKEMRPELEHLIDRVLVPILVERYVNRLKSVSLNSGVAQ